MLRRRVSLRGTTQLNSCCKQATVPLSKSTGKFFSDTPFLLTVKAPSGPTFLMFRPGYSRRSSVQRKDRLTPPGGSLHLYDQRLLFPLIAIFRVFMIVILILTIPHSYVKINIINIF